MKVLIDRQAGLVRFVPVEQEEEQEVAAILEKIVPGGFIKYGGRSTGDDGSIVLFFRIEREKVLTLRGSTKEDKKAVGSIRDTCYFSSSKLTLVCKEEIDGKSSLVLTAQHCKQCQSPMIDMPSCEWGICAACAEKCEHKFVPGPVHGGKVGSLGLGEFCDRCGRGKPDGEVEKYID